MKRALITGGAGFVGCNLAERLIGAGQAVTIYDNLSRRGARSNLDWLLSTLGAGRFQLVQADVRDYERLKRAAREQDVIYHLAGQVAVTTSVLDPRDDFENNTLGTFNALEAARAAGNNPIFIYASTNKVYGGMDDVAVVERATRYEYRDLPNGVSEHQPLDFHSPYGCSKGAGDQYVRDYARIYGLRTVVMRQSCIYGARQFGIEDQGWIAWFIIAAVTGKPITIYGDGKQVRDILFVTDLLDAYQAAIDRIDAVAGQVYNIGGGPENTLSVWVELGPMLEELLGRKVKVSRGDWRPGDQHICIMDTRKAQRELGWRPQVGVAEGVRRLYEWVAQNKELFK
jgi:CDP-paratose 2-epimerase